MSLLDSTVDPREDTQQYRELGLGDLRERQGSIDADDCHVIFDNVSYYFMLKKKRITLLANVFAGIPKGRKIAVLGHKGVGKSSLLELLAQKSNPTRGRVVRNSAVSWPLNTQQLFTMPLTVRDNLVFAARTYLLQRPRYVLERAVYFAELDVDELNRPMSDLDSRKRRRIALALGLMGNFDVHLFDGPTRAQPFGFATTENDRFSELIFQKDYIISVAAPAQIPQNCDLVYILYQGQLYMFENIDLAKQTFASLPAPVLVDEGQRGGDGDDGDSGAGLEAF